MSRDFGSVAPKLKAVGPINGARPYIWRDPETIPTRKWLYGRDLLRGTVTVVVAPGGTGKTALLTGTALALATGRAILHKPIHEGRLRVWIWQLEDSVEEMARAVQAACLHWNISRGDIVGRLFLNSALDGDELKVASEDRDGVTIRWPTVDAVADELIEKGIDVLIVDPFVSSHDVNENSNTAIDAVAKAWAMIAVRANCSIVLVHHVSKAGSAEVTANSARGAVALTAAARSVLALNRMSEAEAKNFGIDGERRRRYFRSYDDKANRAPPADASDWFELVSVSLGNGPDGGDSMGVVVPWSPPNAFEGVTGADLLAVQHKVASGEWRKDAQSPDWVGRAVAAALGLSITDDRARIARMVKVWIDNGALVVTSGVDGKRNKRDFVAVGEWADTESASR
jgi:hypothetical protein